MGNFIKAGEKVAQYAINFDGSEGISLTTSLSSRVSGSESRDLRIS